MDSFMSTLPLSLPIMPLQCDNREDWLAARRYMIGASESAALFGCGYAGQSPVSIWSNKVEGEEDHDDEKRLKIGKLIEPALRAIFSDETGLPCESPGEFAIYKHPELSIMGATLDGLTEDEQGVCPVELKNVSYFNRNEWLDEPPLKYQVQVQHQLAVTGAKRGYLLGFIGGNDPIIKIIPRNDRFIESTLMPKIEQFWQFVKNRELPPIDGSQATASLLARLYPEDDGATVILPQEAEQWDRELTEAKERIKHFESIKQLAENRIKDALKSATVGMLPSGECYTWKVQVSKYAAREAYESAFRVLRRKK
jgi:putative phage-type endonuclease